MKQPIDITGSVHAGVEAVFVSRNRFVLNIVVCRKKKDRLEILQQQQNLEAGEACKHLKKAGNVHLCITGKPVVFKKLSKYYDNGQELTGVLLPDARAAEFVSQSSAVHNRFYGAVIRQDLLHEVLSVFTRAGVFVQTIALGPSVLELLPLLCPEREQVNTAAYTVQIHASVPVFSTHGETPAGHVVTGDDRVHECNLAGLCLNIAAQLGQPRFSPLNDAEAQRHRNEALHKKRFRRNLAAAVVLLLLITGINFFINRSYANLYSELEEKLALDQQLLAEIRQLEQDISEKKMLLGQHPAAAGPVISLVADRLAAVLPAGIKLLSMDIFPPGEKITKEKTIAFAFGKTVVEGSTPGSEMLDEWINRCKKFEWIKDVLIVKYHFDSEKQKALFRLEFILQ